MPFPNEHSARINDPDKYKRIRRENDKFGPGIDTIWGVKEDDTTEVQAIRFDKTKFTVDQAKAWLKEHDYSPISFEAATGKTAFRQRLVKHIIDAQIVAKSLEDGTGVLEGHAAAFNNLDVQNDIIRPGAFKKTAAERVPAGKVELMTLHFAHGGDVMDNVGTVTKAEEDDHGLYIYAPFLPDEMSQSVRAKVKARLGAGKKVGLSIGYRVIKERPEVIDGKTVNILEELILDEVTITLLPANEKALVTAAKSIERILDEIPELQGDQTAPGGKTGRELSKDSLESLDEVLGVLRSLAAKIEKLSQNGKKEGKPKTSKDRLHFWKKRVELQERQLKLILDRQGPVSA